MIKTKEKNVQSSSSAFNNFEDLVRETPSKSDSIQIPALELPRGGGAIKGIGEKFQVNSVTGTSSFSIPLPLTQSRHGIIPDIGLSYNSGSGNSLFGMGWQLNIASITRKTDDKLPEYRDKEDSDTFILSGAEDLVPLLEFQEGNWVRHKKIKIENGISFTVNRYRPRIEGLFARIERWENNSSGEVHWKTITSQNVHSYFGLTSESRILDPKDVNKVYEWKLCRVHDDKGNITVYKYKKEDFTGITKKANEKNRIGNCTQTYLKQVFYGNKAPYYLGDAIPGENDFMFKVIFDYGEHDQSEVIPKDINLEKGIWLCRKDAFSNYRPGFEIRTYRRCRRVLMFHCFDSDELPHNPYLTKSLQLFFDEEIELKSTGNKLEGFSFLVRARESGHLLDEDSNVYKTKSLPDIDIKYQQHEWNTEIKTITKENLVNIPSGLSGGNYLWIDLFNEGISGILTEQAGGWFYKSNLGDGNFSNAVAVADKPSFHGLSSGRVMVQELEGNGVKYLVNYAGEPKGFFKINEDDKWEAFKNFSSVPKGALFNPNMRPVDLNGDGLADLLITEESAIHWYPSAGEKGFEVSQTITKEIDEEKGPAIVFADSTQSIFLADMNGDGLTDIMRIRNGEVCYWPNLGYGRFGAKISMDNAPIFDHSDSFKPNFLRLADVDGSGSIDIVYLGKNDFRVWMNLNGNEWSAEPQIIPAFPHIDKLADVAVLDLLGSGTACIVYSSPLSLQPLQYIDLTNGKKPFLFTGYSNNTGNEVVIEYKSSTFFYLEDKKQGHKWITKLHFPVHCISKVRSEDMIRKTVFTSSYRYRHGYFDHEEKEFRGFARVEQLDTEEFAHFKLNQAKNVVEEELHQPPVKSISWFHTGAFLNNKKIIHQCEDEYFKNNFLAEHKLPEPIIAEELSDDELREAYRSIKGKPVRVEIYSEDNSEKSEIPYSASQSTYEIRLVQPKRENEHASFLVMPAESVAYSYEKDASDPRISHIFSLETDEFGNLTKTSSVVYPRVRRPETPFEIPDKVWNEQNQLHIIYGESIYTNDIIEDNVYRLRAAFESRAYEISGIVQPSSFFIDKNDLKSAIEAAEEILFEQEFTSGVQKRLNNHSRIYFLKDDFSEPLQLGELSHLSIVHKSFNLAFTKNLVTRYYETKVTDQMLVDAMYVHLEGDEHWWVPSGTAIYSSNPRNDFFTPVGARDAFGNVSTAEYDKYFLLLKSSTDAIGNTSSVVNDYRVLRPVLFINPNLNRSTVETDELGIVIKSAIMGKEGSGEGDNLSDPTVKMEYNLFNWQNNNKPNFVHVFAREKHGTANTRFQENFVYSDGSGSVIMIKSQANPGIAKKWNPETKQIEEIAANPRWIGNGRIIFNNKGNPVKEFEPYFSTTHEFESEDLLVETGVSPIIFYDPLGRKIKTEYPDGTFCKVEFDSWQFKSFDLNDTVKDSQWYIDRGSPDPELIPEPSDPEQRAAWLAAKHYNTPSLFYTDSIGRPFITAADLGGGKRTFVQMESDALGRYAKSFDQFDREISSGFNNMVGSPIYCKTAEKGEKWVFQDVLGRIVKIWNSFNREFRFIFDKLHRPVSSFVKDGNNEILYAHKVYGDLLPDATDRNMKGMNYQLYDQASVVTIQNYDFKGNAIQVETRLIKEYKQAVDWMVLEGETDIETIGGLAEEKLEEETFRSSVILDALNRPVEVTLPDNSLAEPKYNEANYLDSLKVKIRGTGDFINFLVSQDYDAKGQRQFARLGNGVITKYFYDAKTFRLTNLLTKQFETDDDSQSIQNIKYTFDAVGNITQIRDNAQQTHFFRNAVIFPENKFEYDSLYQLKKATGREHAGLVGNTQSNHSDLPFVPQLPHQNDSNAVRVYTEQYAYDDCGNIKEFKHIFENGGWTQRYKYEYEDDPANSSNHLKATSLQGDADGVFSALYTHDIHGNMLSMPHLSAEWNFLDQLKQANLGGGGTAFYIYSSTGTRIRKIIERNGGKKIERIYLGAVEIFRERSGNEEPDLERFTLFISDNTGRIAQVDTKTIDKNNTDPSNGLNENNIRYQFYNYLGSSVLETNNTGVIISYEEYHPYGTSAYRLSNPNHNISLKRYRFSGKERDDETGFYYFGARYYCSWLGRWTSSDPAGIVDGLNLYSYCSNNPIMFFDPNGTDGKKNRIIRHGPPELKDPSKKAEAKAYLEKTLNITIHEMYWLKSKKRWHVERYVNNPPPPPGEKSESDPSEPSTGSEGVQSEGPQETGTEETTETTEQPAEGSEGTKNEKVENPQEGDPEGKKGGSTEGTSPTGSEKGSKEGIPEGVEGGSPEGKPGETGTGRSFWSRGGSTLLMGLALLAAGLLTIFTLGLATPFLIMAAGAMALAGGIAITTVSIIQLTASYSGATTARQDAELKGVMNKVSSLSSPMGLAGGTIGTAVAGEEGLETGALIGNVTELGTGFLRFGWSKFSSGSAVELSTDAKLISDMSKLESTVPRGVQVIGSHGRPGLYKTGAGTYAPISELAPLIQSGPQGRVMILMCNVGKDPAAVQALSKSTGRSITAFTNYVGATKYSQVWAFSKGGKVLTYNATPSVFNPQYWSPFLTLKPNVMAPGAAAAGGVAANTDEE